MEHEDKPQNGNRIVVDGGERIREGNAARIRQEVKARFAHELAQAGFFRRIVLQWRMRAEIRRELKRIAPREGLYARNGY